MNWDENNIYILKSIIIIIIIIREVYQKKTR
jgi:hypothetical protein